ncbi:MAG: CDP-diacylglycerol--serine O-phosphatidyltransferase [Alphaproteobacteria bacterium 41-28]|nr:MAG: CDP-diacylglycerol--serine O-phosphatidyltransferase [Alphaproteobacteria bacterium 41-28]
MKTLPPAGLKRSHLIRVIPNAITITALCTGLSSIRFALIERWEFAVSLILLAAILDALDGRIARFLRADSHFGAELDSLSDFISFGVAPAVVLYLYSLHLWKGTGWALALFFSTCMALRLARFNTSIDVPRPEWAKRFSVGVPAPAGAVLGLLPLMVSFALEENFQNFPILFAISLLASGLLMISRIPTFLMKNVPISHHFIRPILMMVAVFMAALFSIPWWILSIVAVLYLFSIPLSLLSYRRKKSEE